MTRLGQLLLVVAALGLWIASRMSWVQVTSFDGLGQPEVITLSGASWSTALVPLALLLVATAVAVLAVRGWPLRLLAILVALVSGAIAYVAIAQWVVRDVAVRGAGLAEVPVASLVASERYYWGAAVALVSALCTLVAAVLLIRSAGRNKAASTKYAAPAARRAAARETSSEQLLDAGAAEAGLSERMIWDALDEGQDPTTVPADSDALPQEPETGKGDDDEREGR
ncbi:MAG: TIGR02234 family membrane protein [Mycobacterium sp.]